jgi:hypothetical protein
MPWRRASRLQRKHPGGQYGALITAENATLGGAVRVMLPLSGETQSMPTKEIFQAIGLGTPFIFGAATYGFFYWLDRSASAKAIRAISGWLKGQPYTRVDIKGAILAAFDRLYTSPLLTIRAFIRSSLFSATLWIAYSIIGIVLNGEIVSFLWNNFGVTILGSSLFLTAVIISDYMSLFVVRRSLFLFGEHPIKALTLGVTLGICVIILVHLFLLVIWVLISGLWFRRASLSSDYLALTDIIYLVVNHPIFFIQSILSAFLVHLWLVLFAIGATSVRLLYPIFRAVDWVQWFLKAGTQHPLRAIGIVAGVLVFVSTAIARLFMPII